MITQQLQGLNSPESKSLKETVNRKLFVNLVWYELRFSNREVSIDK